MSLESEPRGGMDKELETLAAASAAGWLKRRTRHAAAPGQACANCGTVLQGAYCHQCGQLAEDFHRSVMHLVSESFESLFHVDSRIWRTLARLATDPGGLTRDYLEGRRASQIPPFRMFLVVLLAVFLSGGLAASRVKQASAVRIDDRQIQLAGKPTGSLPAQPKRRAVGSEEQSPFGKWADQRSRKAMANREQFWMVLETWAHRLAILMLPMGALILTALFAFQKRFFVFDHLVFTMHSLSFQGVLMSTVSLLTLAVGGYAGWLYLAAPVHLFVHMRKVYGTGVPGTLLRMALLFIASWIGVMILMAMLLLIGLNAMGGQ